MSQYEQIIQIVAVVWGILLCLLGLKIIRLWAPVSGFILGAAAGITPARILGLPLMETLIAGAVAGIIIAVLAGILFRVGIFFTAFLTVAVFCALLIRPEEWIGVIICAAVGIIAAVLSIFFSTFLLIVATSLCGGIMTGTAGCMLLGFSDSVILPISCAVIIFLGILIQLLIESGKQKKINLAKAQRIREENSTAKEVEKARSVMDDIE